MIDIFNDDAFSTHELTASINLMPYQPRRVGEMNLFDKKPVRTPVAFLERRGDALAILETKPRGSGLTNKRPSTTRDMLPIYIPHIPLDDAVLASEVSGVRRFGTEADLETVSQVVSDKLEHMRQLHEVTHEYHRLGAIKGVILDGDSSSTVLYNLFTLFGITQELVTFDLSGDGENIKRTCSNIILYMEEKLGGATYDYVHCLCGNDFFQDLVNNPKVEATLAEQSNYTFPAEQQGTGTLGPRRRPSQLMYGDILFENYRGKVGDRAFIEPDEAHFFPVGVPELFMNFMAPAETMTDVNKPGKEIYAMQEPKPFDAGMDLHTESNPLMICSRPILLVKGFAGATST